MQFRVLNRLLRLALLAVAQFATGCGGDSAAPDRNANSDTAEHALTDKQRQLLATAKADGDYQAWVEVDELTRHVPDELDELDKLRRQLKPIASRWTSSSGVYAFLANSVEEGRRMNTKSAREPSIMHAQRSVASLRADVRESVIETILARDLPSLSVTREALVAFGRQEGMAESWDEGEQMESAEWRCWTIAQTSSVKGPRRSAKGSYVSVQCDASGAVKWASLKFDSATEVEYMLELVKLPEAERDMKHASHVRQALTDLPAIVHRFLLVAAPEQAVAAVEYASKLATQTPEQFRSGIKKGTQIWSSVLAEEPQRQVTVTMIPGIPLMVSVTHPALESRRKEIEELIKALGE